MPVFILILVSVILVLLGVGVLAAVTGRRVWFFTNDPFVLGHLPFYAGIISNIGILLWCTTAAVCFFSAYMAMTGNSSGKYSFFLFCSGALTTLLLFDDLFQMHRIFYPKFMELSTILVYLVYGILLLWYIVYFFKLILQTEFLLLGCGIFFFGLAVVLDTFSLFPRGNTAVSDGFKLLGIVSWLAYFVRTCVRILRPDRREAEDAHCD